MLLLTTNVIIYSQFIHHTQIHMQMDTHAGTYVQAHIGTHNNMLSFASLYSMISDTVFGPTQI